MFPDKFESSVRKGRKAAGREFIEGCPSCRRKNNLWYAWLFCWVNDRYKDK